MVITSEIYIQGVIKSNNIKLNWSTLASMEEIQTNDTENPLVYIRNQPAFHSLKNSYHYN